MLSDLSEFQNIQVITGRQNRIQLFLLSEKILVSFWYFFPFQEPNPSLTPTHYQCSNTKKEHFIPWGVGRLGNFGEEKGELFTLISMMPLPTGLLGTKSKKWWFEEKG